MNASSVKTATRVVVADDHALLRAGLSVAVKNSRDFQMVGQAEGPNSLECLLQDQGCDLLIVDLHMPQEGAPDGHAMLVRLRSLYPDLRIIVFTADDDPEQADVAFTCGADGFMHKRSGVAELLVAMQHVIAGHRYLCSTTRGHLSEQAAAEGSQLGLLTACEADVLRLLKQGLTLTAIAQLRKRTVATISHQKISAMRRLGVNGDAEFFALLARL